jgi:hypothetical protein
MCTRNKVKLTIPNVITVKNDLMKKATVRLLIIGNMSSTFLGQSPISSFLLISHGLDKLKRSFATGSFVSGFQKLISPVIKATNMTSTTGCCFTTDIFRKDFAHARDALIKRAPIAPPTIPTKMNPTSSKSPNPSGIGLQR